MTVAMFRHLETRRNSNKRQMSAPGPKPSHRRPLIHLIALTATLRTGDTMGPEGQTELLTETSGHDGEDKHHCPMMLLYADEETQEGRESQRNSRVSKPLQWLELSVQSVSTKACPVPESPSTIIFH